MATRRQQQQMMMMNGGFNQGPPQPVEWMDKPSVPGCPPGLEYLTQVDQLLISQQIELLEIITNWETANRYKIMNTMGQQVFFAHEESSECQRQCCKGQREFEMHLTDNAGNEIIKVHRDFKCCTTLPCCVCCACCACCSPTQHAIQIECPIGTPIGSMRQSCTCLAPKYDIYDENDQVVLKMEGPACMCQGICCTGDIDFNIFSPDKGQQIGKISKQWGGMAREAFTAADNFGITFPMDMDVKMKAVLLGAIFLIDFMFFENRGNQ